MNVSCLVNRAQLIPTSLCGVAALSLILPSCSQLWWINLLVEKQCPTVHVLPKTQNRGEIRRQSSFKLHVDKDQYWQCCFEIIQVCLCINLKK